MKELFALGATALIVIAYLPYISDVLKEKTRPHPYSWFISGFLTMIVFGLQVSKSAGWGAVPTFIAGVAGLLIFILSFIKKRAHITRSDNFFLVLALIAIGLWLIAHQPVLSVILISLANILAFVPTIRKSWKKPNQETLFTYCINCLRFALSAIAVQNYSIVTILFPACGVITNGFIAIYLQIRRHIVKIS